MQMPAPAALQRRSRLTLVVLGVVAFMVIAGGIWLLVRPTVDAHQQQSFATHDAVVELDLDPDQQSLLIAAYGTPLLSRQALSGGQPPHSLLQSGPPDDQVTVAFSPDKQWVATRSDTNAVEVRRRSDGMLHATFTVDGANDVVMSFSPDSSELVIVDSKGKVGVWRVADGTMARELGTLPSQSTALAFRPDGQILAIATVKDHLIHLWRYADGQPLATLHGNEDDVFALAFRPDGKVLASGSGYTLAGIDDELNAKNASVRLWSIPEGQLLQTLIEHVYGVGAIAFSPDGQWLAAAGGVTRLPDHGATQH